MDQEAQNVCDCCRYSRKVTRFAGSISNRDPGWYRMASQHVVPGRMAARGGERLGLVRGASQAEKLAAVFGAAATRGWAHSCRTDTAEWAPFEDANSIPRMLGRITPRRTSENPAESGWLWLRVDLHDWRELFTDRQGFLVVICTGETGPRLLRSSNKMTKITRLVFSLAATLFMSSQLWAGIDTVELFDPDGNFINDGGADSAGATTVGQTIELTYQLDNVSTSTVFLDPVQVGGGTGSSVSVTLQLPGSLGAGKPAFFTLRVEADRIGSFARQISFEVGFSTYNFTLTGNVEPIPDPPEIDLEQGGSNIHYDDEFSWGQIPAGAPQFRNFDIENDGDEPLTITNLRLSPSSGSGFTIERFPSSPIGGGESDDFQIKFQSGVPGEHEVTVLFNHNDPEEDNPFRFDMVAVVPPQVDPPEIRVTHGGNSIPDGGSFTFDPVEAGGIETEFFAIHNDGEGDLVIDSMSVDSPFSVSGISLPTTISGGNSRGFALELSSTSPGSFSEVLQIQNNDSNEDPFDITLMGSVDAPNQPPTISSLSDSPDPVVQGQTLTLTANGVSDPDPGDAVERLEFYRDSNGNGSLDVGSDQLLGQDTSSSGGWNWSGSTAGFPVGPNRFFARAYDGELWSNVTTANGTVQVPAAMLEVSVGGSVVPDGGLISFGATDVGVPVQRTLTLTNVGGQTLTLNIDDASLPLGFSRVGQSIPTSVPAGASAVLVIEMDADLVAERGGPFTFEWGPPVSSFTIHFSGVIGTPVSLAEKFGNFSSPAGQVITDVLDQILVDHLQGGGTDLLLGLLGDRGYVPVIDADTRSIFMAATLGASVGLSVAELNIEVIRSGYVFSYEIPPGQPDDRGDWIISHATTVTTVHGPMDIELYIRIPWNCEGIAVGTAVTGGGGIAALGVEVGVSPSAVAGVELIGGIEGAVAFNNLTIRTEKILDDCEALIAIVDPDGPATIENAIGSILFPYDYPDQFSWVRFVEQGVGNGSPLFGPTGSIVFRRTVAPGLTILDVMSSIEGTPRLCGELANEVELSLYGALAITLGTPIVELEADASLVVGYSESMRREVVEPWCPILGDFDFEPGDPDHPEDDHGSDGITATSLAEVIGGFSTFGAFDYQGDEDWFRVTAAGGVTYYYYAIPYRDDSARGGTCLPLSEAPLIDVLTEDGEVVSTGTLVGFRRRAVWTPAESGDYLVRFRSATNEVGCYGFAFGDCDPYDPGSLDPCIPVDDDHADLCNFGTTIGVNVTVPGEIEAAGDADSFRFTADAGTTYHVAFLPGSLTSGYLTLSDGAIDLAAGDLIEWVAPSSGDYCIRVEAAAFGAGTYGISLAAVPPAPEIRITEGSGVNNDNILEFPGTLLGDDVMQVFTILNEGSAPLDVTSIEISGETCDGDPVGGNPFVVSPSTATVPPGDQVEVTVTFSPVSVCTFTCQIEVQSNDLASPVVQLTAFGEGLAVPAGGIAEFELSVSELDEGVMATGEVTLDNPAPMFGAEVLLMAEPAGVIDLPPTVDVLAGDTMGSFSFTANEVDADIVVTVTASYLMSSLDDTVTIRNLLIPPIANAGPDQNITLPGGQSVTEVTLDGSGSSDSDGAIAAYEWTAETPGSPDPEDIESPTVMLAEGTHSFALKVFDDDGLPSTSDTVTISVEPDEPPYILSFFPDPSEVPHGDPVELTADAVDPEGDLAEVSFYHDVNENGIADGMDLLLGSATPAREVVSLIVDTSSMPVGTLQLLAVAADGSGQDSDPAVTELTALGADMTLRTSGGREVGSGGRACLWTPLDGSGYSGELLILNDGNALLTLDDVIVESEGLVVGMPAATNLGPGESTVLPISLQPSGYGMVTADVQLITNDVFDDPFTVTVELSVVDQKMGAADGDRLGWSVAGAGDVDGDGFKDLAVSAPQRGVGAGYVHIYSGLTGELLFNITGESFGGEFGNSIAGAGDTNGDGYTDLIIGAPFQGSAGAVYIFRGFAPITPPVTFPASILPKVSGDAADDRFGHVVSGMRDFNGDGSRDILVGAPGATKPGGIRSGRAYIHSGTDLARIAVFDGEFNGDQFGYALDYLGDTNGDGIRDLAIGAFQYGTGTGRCYVHFLPQLAVGMPQTFAPGDAFVLEGAAVDDRFGRALGSAGDVNDDGHDDLLVAAPGADGDTGRVYVYYGADDGARTLTTSIALEGEAPGDLFGASVSTAGDVDGDGRDEFLVGASQHDGTGNDAGRVYLFDAEATEPRCTWDGESRRDFFGDVVRRGGDMDGDGTDELLVGAWRSVAAGTRGGPQGSGSAYVFYLRDLEVIPQCPGDANGDLSVDFADLEILLDAWGTSVTPGEDGDVDESGVVDFADLEILLDEWGVVCSGF